MPRSTLVLRVACTLFALISFRASISFARDLVLPPNAQVVLLADQPFNERPPGRVMISQVKKDKYLLYMTATSDDLVSFTITVPRSGAYRATTRLFNQQESGSARLIVNEYADGPALPLAATLQHGTVEFAAGANVVTYQLSGTPPKTKVRLWELTLVPVLAEIPAPEAKEETDTVPSS